MMRFNYPSNYSTAKLICTFVVLGCNLGSLMSQNQGISISAQQTPPHEDAVFHVYTNGSNPKGMLFPRMSFSDMLAMDPDNTGDADGLIVYVDDATNDDDLGLWIWNHHNNTTTGPTENWRKLEGSKWKENANGIHYDSGFIGINEINLDEGIHLDEKRILIDQRGIYPGSYDDYPSGKIENGTEPFDWPKIMFRARDLYDCNDQFVDLNGTLTFGGQSMVSCAPENGIEYEGFSSGEGQFNFNHGVSLPYFSTSSDERLKKNIQPIYNSREMLMKLHPVAFEFKDAKIYGAGVHYGVIAQELETVLPNAVKTDLNGNLSVIYTEMIPIIMDVVQQQQESLEELVQRANSLEND